MAELTFTNGIVPGYMSIPPQSIPIGHKTIKSNGPPGRKRLGADADFSTKAIAETIRKAAGTVVIDP